MRKVRYNIFLHLLRIKFENRKEVEIMFDDEGVWAGVFQRRLFPPT